MKVKRRQVPTGEPLYAVTLDPDSDDTSALAWMSLDDALRTLRLFIQRGLPTARIVPVKEEPWT